MNKKNMLFLALVGLNINTFGMETFKEMIFGHDKKIVANPAGWTLSKTYESSHIAVNPIETDITKKLFLSHTNDVTEVMDQKTLNMDYNFKHPHGIWSVSFFPTGDRIATVSDDQFLRIFALKGNNNNEPIAQFTCHDNIRSVGFDKDGSLLVRTFQGRTHVFVNDDKYREHRYLEELSIAYLAEEQADTSKIDSGDLLVTTFALHFALDEDQLKIIWNTISADTQKLLLNAVQNRDKK